MLYMNAAMVGVSIGTSGEVFMRASVRLFGHVVSGESGVRYCRRSCFRHRFLLTGLVVWLAAFQGHGSSCGFTVVCES